MAIYAWHFLPGDGTKYAYKFQPVKPDGVPFTVRGRIVPCSNGLHASTRLYDALGYAQGATLCRVKCEIDIVKQSDKLACRKRTILWRLDRDEFSNILYETIVWCVKNLKNKDGETIDKAMQRKIRSQIGPVQVMLRTWSATLRALSGKKITDAQRTLLVQCEYNGFTTLSYFSYVAHTRLVLPNLMSVAFRGLRSSLKSITRIMDYTVSSAIINKELERRVFEYHRNKLKQR